jgi:hypothetical protein
VSLRIPFAESVSEPLLFKKAFDSLSTPQRAALRIFYGMSLSDEELEWWSVSQESCLYDELYRVIAVTPVGYEPREYSRATLCIGRRGAKTSGFSSFVVAYEALCGGHNDRVKKGQDFYLLQVAQDLSTARSNLKQHIIPILEQSKIGAKELQDASGKLNVTAEQARLKNGALITVAPPTMKIRGQAIAVCAMDEVAFWPSDHDSAQPDVEVERAVVPAMAQFPNRKLVKTSTPYSKDGLLWRDYQIGTSGTKLPEYKRGPFKNFLLLHASTLAMQNPVVEESFIQEQFEIDPEAFGREYGAQFSDAVSGFLNPALLREAVGPNIHERAYDSKWFYIAALDPAFRGDTFAFTIGHYEPVRGFVQDVIREFKPAAGVPLNPSWVLDQIVPLCSAYAISTAYSDQHEIHSLAQLAMDRGLFLERVVFSANSKSSIYGNFQQLLNQKRMHLLDHPAQLQELLNLERTLLAQGGVRIAGKRGKHDDLATVCAICAYKAQGLTPHEDDGSNPISTKHPTNEEAVWAFTSPKKKEQWWD